MDEAKLKQYNMSAKQEFEKIMPSVNRRKMTKAYRPRKPCIMSLATRRIA